MYVWISPSMDAHGQSGAAVKVDLHSVVFNEYGGVALLYTANGPKYFSEVQVPPQFKNRLKEIEKILK